MGYFKEVNVLVVCAIFLLDINDGKQRLNIRISQIEIDLDGGFVEPHLNFCLNKRTPFLTRDVVARVFIDG